VAEPAPTGLLLDIADILHATAESVRKELDVPLDAIEVGPSEFAPEGPVHVDVTLTYVGTAVLAEGSVDATVRTTCVRCLGELDIRVHGTIEGFYVPHGTEHELPEEQEYEFIEGTAVDVLPAIRSALIVEFPFAPVHSSGCETACPRCGQTADACVCDGTPADSPFAALKDIFSTDDE
jgi:uncharacterized protein